MIVIKLGKHLLHDGFTEKSSLCTYTELVAILPDRRHLTVIQIDDLPVPAHKSSLLFLEILGIDSCSLPIGGAVL